MIVIAPNCDTDLNSENKNSLNTKASMTINPTSLGEVSAKIKDQTSKLFGAGIVFPEGSLAKQDTSFTLNLESGQTNITTQVLNDLDTKDIKSIVFLKHFAIEEIFEKFFPIPNKLILIVIHDRW